MPGDFYGSFSIPHDEFSRQMQLAQLHCRSAAAEDNGARRHPLTHGYANRDQFDYEEAMRTTSAAVALK